MFFNVYSSRVFEPDKISLIRSIALLMVVIWLVKVANGGWAWMKAWRPSGAAADPADESGQNWSGWVRNPLFIPVILLITAYLLSTLFSVAGFVSWFGSYQRLQGTYTFLSYITIAGLTAATLRKPAQLRRLQHAVIIASFPIALYGIIQRLGNDPLPWGGDVTQRVASTAGNAIFLAAYLIMAFFLTLERVFSNFVRLLGIGQQPTGDRQEWQSTALGALYLFILLVQSIAIFWTDSRGPWLGWFLAIYLFVLLALSVVRPRGFKLWTGIWVGLGLFGAGFVIALNVVPALQPIREIPIFNRLSSVLNLEQGTGRVRVLIWEGSSEMIRPHDPLTFPDGSQDAINAIRPLLGYGPEAMWVAFNPFYPPDLAHVEARNASPDRSHNETWDSLVITGLLGFGAQMAVFISIFYWALSWLGLITNRRDSLLFFLFLFVAGVGAAAGLMLSDDGKLRLFAVGLPFGLIAGLALYTSLAAFLHAGTKVDRSDFARQMMVIALFCAIIAHFFEIHFGIAIASTRTHFWVLTALLMVLGMRLAQPVSEDLLEPAAAESGAESEAVAARSGKAKPASAANRSRLPRRRVVNDLPLTPLTVMSDLLAFLTLVYVFTTNGTGQVDGLQVLLSSVLQRPGGEGLITSPSIFLLLVFTWLVAVVVGLAEESVSRRNAPSSSWWWKAIGVHAAIVWGGWFVYGLWQGLRLTPMSAPAGTTNEQFLNMQLERVAGHFGLFTGIAVTWILGTGLVYAWRSLREKGLPATRRLAAAAISGITAGALALALIIGVNVNLVKADIVYKQGQQFDAQGNWINSVELYRRALATRATEDHYMLFLGRALLEQAKLAPATGAFTLPEQPTLDDVLALEPIEVSQMSRDELLRAAETVLLNAQRVNPLNTDHTANLARLYRTWADLIVSENPEKRAELLQKSIDIYEVAVTLSPNAAHLWNERGNAYLAAGDNDQALAAYEKSLSLDQQYDQTYLLLADFLERNGQMDELVTVLQQGIDIFTELNNPGVANQLLSYLSVALARNGDMQGAADANLKILATMPTNTGALRNLAVIARDQGDLAKAMEYADQALAVADPANVADLKTLYQLSAELWQMQGNTDKMIEAYENMRRVDPADMAVLGSLINFYSQAGNDAKIVEIGQQMGTLDPGNWQHPFNVAQALARQGDAPNALVYAQQALALAPDDQKPVVQQLITALGG
jgi:tetratricopeptide (TPR) repeat protein